MELWRFDEVLSRNDYFILLEEFDPFYNHWCFTKSEYKEKNSATRAKKNHIAPPNWGALQKPRLGGVGDNLVFINFAERLKYLVQKTIQRKVRLTRINTNIQFPLQESTFHYDGGNDSWTLILFVCKGWDPSWGGDFICLGGDEQESVPCKPNTGVLFNASLMHRGIAPNQFALFERKTIAFTYRNVSSGTGQEIKFLRKN